ncbi:hypothetical protein AB0J86_25325 [Micromonospora sp. NPDC049559]|uniref:hypothetical protein n=1 Tax=Micromonospora sp. NPDC049559 TaxID=3155923 RepID=UPI003431B022
MNVRLSKAGAVAVSAIGVGAALAFALPAGAAVSVQSESPSIAVLKLGDQARLDANGAVVFAPITLACTPGSSTLVGVRVTQAVGGGDIAQGSTVREVEECRGKNQRIQLAVSPSQKAFRKGIAFGSAYLDVCDHRGCRTVWDEHNIQIVK